MKRSFFYLILVLVVCGFTACTSDQAGSHSHAEGEADHEHGPGTHTHDDIAVAADTAGTYADSTAASFFEGDGHDDDDHEHGPDTHTHDSDTGHN